MMSFSVRRAWVEINKRRRITYKRENIQSHKGGEIMPKVEFIGELNIEDMVDYMGKLLSEQFGAEITMKAVKIGEKQESQEDAG